MRYTIALLPFALSACVGLATVEEAKPARLSADQVATVQATVTRDFFDPSTAQFRNVRAADVTLAGGEKVRRVCGEVNGKNRMGGYVGYAGFGGVMNGSTFTMQNFYGPCKVW